MRGHDALIELRRRHRMCPGLVFVDLVAEPSPAAADWQHWATQAHIEVTDAESIRRLDLRFVVGLFVCCGGTDADRVNALHDACVSAGAAEVFSAVYTDTADGSHALSRRATWEACSHG